MNIMDWARIGGQNTQIADTPVNVNRFPSMLTPSWKGNQLTIPGHHKLIQVGTGGNVLQGGTGAVKPGYAQLGNFSGLGGILNGFNF